MSNFKPSVYQQAIYDWVKNGSGSAIVQAVAGSGKSTTLVAICALMSGSVTLLAFNKAIATAIQAKLPSHVQAKTFHSAGYGAWMKFVGRRVSVDEKKCATIFDTLMGGRDAARRNPENAYRSFSLRLVGLAKGVGIGYLADDTHSNWVELAERHDLYVDGDEGANYSIDRGIELAREILKMSNTIHDTIDFDDMLYLPLINDVSFFRVDWLLIDEAQDTNGVQLALMKRMVKKTGRVVAVGDKNQAIYGFRGADAEAMGRIGKAFGCTELPLSICYRCSSAVVAYAKKLVPQIEAAPTAATGAVSSMALTAALGQFQPNDAVLCRNTAPVVTLAYKLLGKGVGCRIMGRDIGKGLVALIERMKAKGIEQLLTKLDVWAEREIARARSKDDDSKAQQIEDRVSCVKIIIEALDQNNRTIPALIISIEKMFSDDDRGVLTLGTIHRSKGLEFKRVFALAPELLPSKSARQPWQQVQEQNLDYVMRTRAIDELVYLEGSL